MSDLSLKSDKAFEKAKAGGWVVVVPKPNELLIDIDGERDLEVFHENYPIFDEHVCHIVDYQMRPSKSGNPGKKHITVQLARDITPTERLLFQMMLGSDRKRDLLSFARIKNDDLYVTLFFERPEDVQPNMTVVNGNADWADVLDAATKR